MPDQYYSDPPFIIDPRDPRYRIGPRNPRIVCRDGFSMSVQAQYGCYCIPEETNARHTHLECGFPSSIPLTEELRQHIECHEMYDRETGEERTDFTLEELYTKSVYPHVPRHVIEKEFALHGGIVQGRIPY